MIDNDSLYIGFDNRSKSKGIKTELRNRHDEEAIDNAIYEAEKEFAETGEYILAKDAFDELEKNIIM